VHVIDMFCRDKAMQRRVDRGGARVEIECAVTVRGNHVIFGGGFEAFVAAIGVNRLKVAQLALIERGEVLFRCGAQVSAGTFNPEDINRLAGEWVFLGDLGRSIAAAGIGDALVSAEFV
jgi:hypothetical protein